MKKSSVFFCRTVRRFEPTPNPKPTTQGRGRCGCRFLFAILSASVENGEHFGVSFEPSHGTVFTKDNAPTGERVGAFRLFSPAVALARYKELAFVRVVVYAVSDSVRTQTPSKRVVFLVR